MLLVTRWASWVLLAGVGVPPTHYRTEFNLLRHGLQPTSTLAETPVQLLPIVLNTVGRGLVM